MYEDGDSLLIATLKNDLGEAIRLLTYYKIDVDYKDKDNYTSLHFATLRGNLDIMKLLIKNGADVNSINKDGDTAFTLASKKGSVDIVKTLIANGAKIDETNERDDIAIIFAAATNKWTLVNKLIKKSLRKSGIRFVKSIYKCHESHTNKRTENLFTLNEWNKYDIFVKLSDGHCYSIKEIRSLYHHESKKSLITRALYSTDDLKTIEIIGELLLPIEPYEPDSITHSGTDSETDSEIDSENNERKGGYIKKKRHAQKTKKIRHACAKRRNKKNTHTKTKK